ncbi:MAG: hypothetical protein RL885_01810 [Planctomycetota bacterium]
MFPKDKTRGILIAGLSVPSPTGELALEPILECIARGEAIREIPRRMRPSLARGLRLFVDGSPGLLPFREDIRRLEAEILRVVGASACEVIRFEGSPLDAFQSHTNGKTPPSGLSTVCLTDLGIGLAPGRSTRVTAVEWLRFCAAVRQTAGRPIAIVPYPPNRWPRALRGAMHLIHWDARTAASRARQTVAEMPAIVRAGAMREELVRKLCELVGCAVRVDAALLRHVRRRYLPGSDASLEADAWFSSQARFQGPDGFIFDGPAAAELRRDLLIRDEALYDSAFGELQERHAHLPLVLQFEEELAFQETIAEHHRSADRRIAARDRMQVILRRVVGATLGAGQTGLLHWAARALPRLPGLLGHSRDAGDHPIEEARMLEASVEVGLNGVLPDSVSDGDGELPEWLEMAAPRTLARRQIAVQSYTGELVFDLPERAGDAPTIELPDTDPLIVELEHGTSTRRVVLDLEEEALTVHLVTYPLHVKSLLGDVFEIEDVQRVAAPADRVIDYSEERERHRGFVGELPFDPRSLPEREWTSLLGDGSTGNTAILWKCVQVLEEASEAVIFHFSHEAMPNWDDLDRAASSLAAQIVKLWPQTAGDEPTPHQRLLGTLARFLQQRQSAERLFIVIGNAGGSPWVLPELVPLLDIGSMADGLVGLIDRRREDTSAEGNTSSIDLLGPEATSLRERAIAQRFDVEALHEWLVGKTEKDPSEPGLPPELLDKLLPEIAADLLRLSGSDWWRASFLTDWLKAWLLNASERSYYPELPRSAEHHDLIQWYLRSDWLQNDEGAAALSGLWVLAAAREALPMSMLRDDFPELIDRCLPLLTALDDRLTLRTGVRDVLSS